MHDPRIERPSRPETDFREVLRETTRTLERLLAIFRVERIVHLVLGIISLGLLIYAVVLMLRQRKEVSPELLVSLWGAGGLITISAARVTQFFGRAFKLIEDIVHVMIRAGGNRG